MKPKLPAWIERYDMNGFRLYVKKLGDNAWATQSLRSDEWTPTELEAIAADLRQSPKVHEK